MSAAAVFQNPEMLSIIHDRLEGLAGRSSGYIASLPEKIKGRVKALQKIQKEHDDLSEELQQEILELKAKYRERQQPLYEKRKTIVDGNYEPSQEECTYDEEDSIDNMEIPAKIEEVSDETKKDSEAELVPGGIPEFWLTALNALPITSEAISEEDEEVLKYLKDIQVTYHANKIGFDLRFLWAENPFFSNEVLKKSYFIKDTDTNEPIFDHAEGDEIKWKENKCLTFKTEVKKQRHKTSNKVRTIKKEVRQESFFHFFSPPQVPQHDHDDCGEDDGEHHTHDDVDMEALESELSHDFDIGEAIEEKLIPNAVNWFTGAALEYESFDEDEDDYSVDDGMDSSDFDADEDVDDEEEEDDEGMGDRKVSARGKGSKKGETPSANAKQQAPECKQQ